MNCALNFIGRHYKMSIARTTCTSASLSQGFVPLDAWLHARAKPSRRVSMTPAKVSMTPRKARCRAVTPVTARQRGALRPPLRIVAAVGVFAVAGVAAAADASTRASLTWTRCACVAAVSARSRRTHHACSYQQRAVPSRQPGLLARLADACALRISLHAMSAACIAARSRARARLQPRCRTARSAARVSCSRVGPVFVSKCQLLQSLRLPCACGIQTKRHLHETSIESSLMFKNRLAETASSHYSHRQRRPPISSHACLCVCQTLASPLPPPQKNHMLPTHPLAAAYIPAKAHASMK